MINTCFVNDDRIFVSLFHKMTLTHWHFFYSHKDMMIVGKPFQLKIDCSELNFPYDTFYDNLRQNVYIFYRQGQCITASTKTIVKGIKKPFLS